MNRTFLKLVAAFGLLAASSVGALAACAGTTAQITDAAAATRQMALISDPTGTNCAGVTASDIRYLAGTALASPSAYGTAPTGQVIGVNAFVTNTTPLGQAALASSSPVVVAKNSGTGSTVAGAAVGTAGTPSAEVVSIQGVSGGTPQPVSAPATGLPSTPGTLAGGATFVKGTTAAMTGTTSTQIIAAVASNRVYAMRVSCKGDPANAVGTKVLIQDGSAGTTLDTLSVAASGGGEQATASTPLFWTTSGNGLFAQNVTTAASVICTASGYSG